jgi:cytochrome P450
MVLNPDVQKKAQEEIDRVVGNDRLPNFDDRDSLIYVEAVIREVMRWHPPLPLGVYWAFMSHCLLTAPEKVSPMRRSKMIFTMDI